MSSFLKRLKTGATNVDNTTPPDSAGAVTRKIEKKTVSQPVEELGITFGNDAEVVSVAPRSPAALANIPVNFMVFDVNGEFIENAQQFEEAARKTVNLVIKLQSTAGISELIARVLRDEEMRASGEISGSSIDFDELLRTTPRFNFLSGDHPLFLRYNRRLKQASHAAALIAQRTQEAEQQRQKEIKERMRKALEEEQAVQRKIEEVEEAERLRKNASPAADTFVSSEPFLKVIKDESEFGRAETVPPVTTNVVPQASGNAAAAETPAAAEVTPLDASAHSEEPVTAVVAAPVSTEELLALVGLPTDLPLDATAAPAVPSAGVSAKATPVPESEVAVQYIALPAEEYTLCSGQRVISVIKRRTGPVPPPPPGRPPTAMKPAPKSGAPSSQQPNELARSAANDETRRRSDRRRSRSPQSRKRSERDYSSREESRHRGGHRSSSSHGDRRSSRDRRYRRH